jgi:hypothetical protein
MKLFLRGAFALGISVFLASTAFSDTPAPPIAPKNKVPISPVMPAAPAVTAQPSAAYCPPAGGEIVGSSRRFGGRLFGGRLGSGGRASGLSGRFDALSERVDASMQKGEERQERFQEFLRRLAGPPVEGTASTGGGFGHAPKAHTQPGTVVFPQHPFVRSPRDYFMQD